MVLRWKAAARRGMIALRRGEGPVVKGPELQPRMSAVVGLVKGSPAMTRGAVGEVSGMVPLTMPGPAWVLMRRVLQDVGGGGTLPGLVDVGMGGAEGAD